MATPPSTSPFSSATASTPIASSKASTASSIASKPQLQPNDRRLILKPLPAVPGEKSASQKLNARYGVVTLPPKIASPPATSSDPEVVTSVLLPASALFLRQFLRYLIKSQSLDHEIWFKILHDILLQLADECRLPAVVEEQVQDARVIKVLQRRLQDKLRKHAGTTKPQSKWEDTRRDLGVKLLGMHLEIIQRNKAQQKLHSQDQTDDSLIDEADVSVPFSLEGARFRVSCTKEIGERPLTHLVYRRLDGEALLRQDISPSQDLDKTNVLGGTIAIKATSMKEAAKVQQVAEVAVYALCNLKLEDHLFLQSRVRRVGVESSPTIDAEEPNTRRRTVKPSFFNWLIWNSKAEPSSKSKLRPRRKKRRQVSSDKNAPLPYLPIPKNKFTNAIQKLQKAYVCVSPSVSIPPPHLLNRLVHDEDNRSGASPDGLPVDAQAGLQCLLADNNTLEGLRRHQRIISTFSRVLRGIPIDDYAPAKRLCEGPLWRTFSYYNHRKKDADFSLGAIIEEILNHSTEICPSEGCGAPLNEHTSSFTHNIHRVDISTSILSKVKHDTAGPSPEPILMWSSCAFCKATTSSTVMTPTTYTYSFGKYLELLCYSSNFRKLCDMHGQPLCRHTESDHPQANRHFSRGNLVCIIQTSTIELYELRVPQMQLLTPATKMGKDSLIANIVNDQDSDYGIESVSVSESEVEDEPSSDIKTKTTSSRDQEVTNNTRLDILHFYCSVKKSLTDIEEYLIRIEPSEETLHSREPSRESRVSASSIRTLGLLNDLKYSLRSDEFELYAQLKGSLPDDLNTIRKSLLDRIRYTTKKMQTWRKKHMADDAAITDTKLTLPEYANDSFHVFPGSSVLIRESEPSSIIAFTLSSKAYAEELLNGQEMRPSVASTPGCEVDRQLSSKHSKTSLLTASSQKTTIDREPSTNSEHLDPDDHDDDQFLRAITTDSCALSISRKHFTENAIAAALSRRGPSGLSESISKSFQLGLGWDKKRVDEVVKPTQAADEEELAAATEAIDMKLSAMPAENTEVASVKKAHRLISPFRKDLSQASITEEADGDGNDTLKASSIAKLTLGQGDDTIKADADTPRPSELSKIAEQLRRMSEQDAAERTASGSTLPIPTELPKEGYGTMSTITSTTPSSPSPFTSIWNFGSMRFRSGSATFGSEAGSPLQTTSHEKMPSILSSEYSTSESSPHLKCIATHKRTKISCTVYYAQEFETLRQNCGIQSQYIDSLSRCEPWTPSGGKSRSSFYLSMDGRFVIKQMLSAWNLVEKDALLKFAPAYFEYMKTGRDRPTILAKIFGFYTVKIKSLDSNVPTLRMDLLVMEHLFHGQHVTRTFDLKGVPDRQALKADGTLWDGDWIANGYKYSHPVHAFSKRTMRKAIEEDSEFLASANVMDYSLLVGVDDVRRELVVGIVDYIGAFTWYKKMESKGKTTLKPGKEVTVLPPLQYKERFCAAVQSYFADVPDKWVKTDNVDDDKLPSVL